MLLTFLTNLSIHILVNKFFYIQYFNTWNGTQQITMGTQHWQIIIFEININK